MFWSPPAAEKGSNWNNTTSSFSSAKIPSNFLQIFQPHEKLLKVLKPETTTIKT
jgi:hypothetical protein